MILLGIFPLRICGCASRLSPQANVRTLSVRLGVNRVFWICIGILELAYLCAMAYGAMRPLLWSKVVVVAGHGLMGWLLLKQAKSVDLQSNR